MDWDDYADAADNLRKERRENGECLHEGYVRIPVDVGFYGTVFRDECSRCGKVLN